MSLLDICGLSIGFSERNSVRTLVQPFNASLQQGEMTTLLGINGAGKSSLLRVLTGLNRGGALAGDVLHNQKTFFEMLPHERAKLISFVPTTHFYSRYTSVYETVAAGRIPHLNWLGKLTVHDQEKIEHALSLTQMQAFRHNDIYTLSDGERKRVFIAQALAQETPLIVLDEPSAYLDLEQKFKLMDLFGMLCRQEHRSILFTSHDISIAFDYSDKIWLLSDCQIHQGAPEDLMHKGHVNRIFDTPVFFDHQELSFGLQRPPAMEICIQNNGLANLSYLHHLLKRLHIKPVEKSIYRLDIAPESFDLYETTRLINKATSYTELAILLKAIAGGAISSTIE